MNRLTGYRSAAALAQKVVVALHPADAVVRLSIRSPEDGMRVLRDPETPPEQSTLALRALVNPPVPRSSGTWRARPSEWRTTPTP